MGTSVTDAKRILYLLEDRFGHSRVDEDLIGMAIQEVRNRKELKYYKRRLDGRKEEKKTEET